MTDLTSLIRLVVERHGKLPSVDWISRTGKVTVGEAQQALDSYTVQEAPFQQAVEAPTEAPVLEGDKVTPKALGHVHGVPMTVLRWIAGILATGAIVRAMFYAFGWFHTGGDEALSWLMSGLVVGVTVVMPQMAVILFRNGSTWLSALAFALTGVVMAFSMLMTVGGIYNQRTAEYNAQQKVQDADQQAERTLVALVDREKLLHQQIDSAVREQARLQKVLDGFSPTDQSLPATQRRLDAQTKRVDGLRGDLVAVGSDKLAVEVKGAPRLDFFDWIAGLLGWSRGAVELASAIIPAVVIDVAAPVLLFVVFFL